MQAALLQTCASDDPLENTKMLASMVSDAAKGGAKFVLTPEVSNCVSTSRKHQAHVLFAPDADPTLAALREAAEKFGVHILIGSLAVKTAEPDGRFANRSFLIGPAGAILATYDKIHMFDVDIDETESFRESAGYRPGQQAVLAKTEFAQIGMCICYDVRFPLLANALAQAGAEILTYPAAFSPVSGAAHWESLLRARAIENASWVIAPAQTGQHAIRHGKPRATYGHSLVVDPWGSVLLDAGTDPGVYAFDLDMEKVKKARKRIPALKNAKAFDGP